MNRYEFVTVDTVQNCLDILAYLKHQFDTFGKLDQINMDHATEALALVAADRRRFHNAEAARLFADVAPLAQAAE